MPSDEDASAEAARSQDFRRFIVTLDGMLPFAYPPMGPLTATWRSARYKYLYARSGPSWCPPDCDALDFQTTVARM